MATTMRALWSSNLSAISNFKISPRIKRPSSPNLTSHRNPSLPMNPTEDPKLRDFVGFLESLKNYEKSGVPKGAGTDSGEGFDLSRMKRLLLRLNNPHFNYKVVLRGPFLPHIEDILRSKAASMSSSVTLASNIGSSSLIKGITNKNGIGLCQSCDIVIQR